MYGILTHWKASNKHIHMVRLTPPHQRNAGSSFIKSPCVLELYSIPIPLFQALSHLSHTVTILPILTPVSLVVFHPRLSPSNLIPLFQIEKKRKRFQLASPQGQGLHKL
ncbi:hypothetical protein OCU04_003555 [Sclerotinia nivalis]|uniref:Uncharacterized protein n=1 Tax=Sclerotinia nivalis TaxID=352851 RepID=A0A9X0ASK3_9HELO|nr:hypothetical protein OCU04_003555 [Sclerotinia nivalis]